MTKKDEKRNRLEKELEAMFSDWREKVVIVNSFNRRIVDRLCDGYTADVDLGYIWSWSLKKIEKKWHILEIRGSNKYGEIILIS